MRSLTNAVALLALFLSLPLAHAGGGTRAQTLAVEHNLNVSATAGPANLVGTKLVQEKVHVLKLTYDFSVLGGASGSALSLRGTDNKVAKLPAGAIVRDCLIDVITAPDSGGSATIAIGTGQAANDLKTATAIASYTGLVACVPVGSAATAIKLTADRTPTATIAVAPLTAGKIKVLIWYELSDST